MLVRHALACYNTKISDLRWRIPVGGVRFFWKGDITDRSMEKEWYLIFRTQVLIIFRKGKLL